MWDPYQSSEDVEIDEHVVRNNSASGTEKHATILALPPASTGKRYFEIIVEKNRGGTHIGKAEAQLTASLNLVQGGWPHQLLPRNQTLISQLETPHVRALNSFTISDFRPPDTWAVDSYQTSKGIEISVIIFMLTAFRSRQDLGALWK